VGPVTTSTRGLAVLAIGLTLALPGGGAPAGSTPTDEELLTLAKSTLASSLDPRLPTEPFERWVEARLAPGAGPLRQPRVSWKVTGCEASDAPLLAKSASYHCVDLVAYEGEGYARFAMRVALEPVPALVSLSVPTGSVAWQSWPITTLDERIAQDRAYYALVERAERESAARERRSRLGFLTSVGLGALAILATLILPTISLTRRRRRGELTSTLAMATRLVLPSGIGLLLAWGLVLAAQRVAPAEGGDMAGLIVPIIMAGELGAWLVLLTLVLLAIRAELGLWFVLLLALLAIGASLSRSSLPLRW